MKPLVLEIPPGSEARQIKGAKDGRSWDFWMQTAYAASVFDGFPNKVEIQLVEAGRSYPPGHYLLAAGSLDKGKTGTMFVNGSGLVPVAEALKSLGELSGSARPAVRAAS